MERMFDTVCSDFLPRPVIPKIVSEDTNWEGFEVPKDQLQDLGGGLNASGDNPKEARHFSLASKDEMMLSVDRGETWSNLSKDFAEIRVELINIAESGELVARFLHKSRKSGKVGQIHIWRRLSSRERMQRLLRR